MFSRNMQVALFQNDYDEEISMLTLDVSCPAYTCWNNTEHPPGCYCDYASTTNCGTCYSWPPTSAFNCTAPDDLLSTCRYSWYEVPVVNLTTGNDTWLRLPDWSTSDVNFRMFLNPAELDPCPVVNIDVNVTNGAGWIIWRTLWDTVIGAIDNSYTWYVEASTASICPQHYNILDSNQRNGVIAGTWWGSLRTTYLFFSGYTRIRVLGTRPR